MLKFSLKSRPFPEWIETEIASDDALVTTRRGTTAIVRPNQPLVAHKIRSEFKVMGQFPVGVMVWVGINILIPTSWRDGAGPAILLQVHDHPPEGVAWADWPSRPPLLALRYGDQRYDFVYGTVNKRKKSDARLWTPGAEKRVVIGFKNGADGLGRGEAMVDGTAAVSWAGPNNVTPSGIPYIKGGVYIAEGISAQTSGTFGDMVISATKADVLKWAA